MLLRALVLAPLRARPWRSLATVLGIAAGVAAFVATLLASRSAVASLEEATGNAREWVRVEAPGGLDEAALSALRPLSEQALILPRMDEWVLERNTRTVLRLYGIDALVDPRLRLAGGPQPRGEPIEATWRGEGVWISESLARALSLVPGDSLALLVRGVPREVRVIGSFAGRGPDDPLQSAVIGDLAAIEALFAPGRRLDAAELLPRPGWSAERLAALARARLSAPLRVETSSEHQRQRQAMVRSLEFNLLSLSGISLLVGAVLVATALASAVVERRKLLALCVSMGASRRQLAGILLFEATLFGLVGGALGALAGSLAAALLAPSMRSSVETVLGALPQGGVRIEPVVVVLGIGMGLCAALLASLLPLVEILRTPPLQSLRREQHEPLGTRARLLALIAAGGLVWLALRLTHVPSPAGLPLSGLGAAIALLALRVLSSPAARILREEAT